MTSADFSLKGLEKKAFVEGLSHTISSSEAIDLLMVGVLDIGTDQELEDTATDLDEIAVAQNVLIYEFVVDVRSVRRAQIP